MSATQVKSSSVTVGKLEVPVLPGTRPSRAVRGDRGAVELTLYRSPSKSVFDAPSPAILAVKVPSGFQLAEYTAWGDKLAKDIAQDKAAKHALAEKIRESLALAVPVGTSKEDVKRVGKDVAGTVVRKSSAQKTIGGLAGLEERFLVGGVYHVQTFATLHEGVLYVARVHGIEPYFSKDGLPKLQAMLAKLKAVQTYGAAEDETALGDATGEAWKVGVREVLSA